MNNAPTAHTRQVPVRNRTRTGRPPGTRNAGADSLAGAGHLELDEGAGAHTLHRGMSASATAPPVSRESRAMSAYGMSMPAASRYAREAERADSIAAVYAATYAGAESR
ncbi:hypothetical protein CSO01_15690 [Cellulomonas soli]|uniref:Uncharacterized protein n=1 Tax=Cellulomonas soli TaxID=931535 RepID=A0A512PCB2_9CELL|nr:hypothetical protein CSO01_15690 [Cellulomonas soli]